MSGISSVGGSSSVVYPIPSSDGSDCPDCNSSDSNSTTPTTTQDGASGSTATSPLGDLRNQIETAVTDAVNQLSTGSSPQDIFSAIQGAVQNTLQANGLDPQQILNQGHGHHHHHAQGAGGDADAAGANDGDADDQQNTTDPLTAPASTSIDALVTLIQQFTNGTESSTNQDGSQSGQGGAAGQPNSLLSALQNSSGGGVNLTSVFIQLFQGFPNGTGLDVQA